LKVFGALSHLRQAVLTPMVEKLVSTQVVLRERATEVPTFEEVYTRWFHEVSRWVRALGGLDADLDDLTQEVFLVVRRKLGQFDGKNLRGWLYRISQRTVRDYRQGAWFRRFFERKPEKRIDREPSSIRIGPLDPGEVFERREAERLLLGLLDQMSETRRTAFILFEIEGYSGEEIATLERVPVNTVWTRLHHARKDFLALIAQARGEGRLT
jgi:RNA polymerase sigma-70 factor (ECF subfamily)